MAVKSHLFTAMTFTIFILLCPATGEVKRVGLGVSVTVCTKNKPNADNSNTAGLVR